MKSRALFILLVVFGTIGFREVRSSYVYGRSLCQKYFPCVKTWECVLYDPWQLKFDNKKRMKDGKCAY